MINSVVLAGNVVADPESRNTNSGKKVATFRLAVNNPISENDVVYVDVDTWEKQAEFVGSYLKKGSSVSVVGRLKQDSWEKDGKKMTKILIVADRVNFFGTKKKGEGANGDEDAMPRAAKPAAKSYSKPASKQAAQQDDDDIPI